MSGSVESGRPTPTRTRWKSGAAELALERLQAVVAGEAAAEARADVAEGQVDLVVEDEHAVEVELERAARGADGAAGLVHVGLRQQHGDARAAGAGAALGQLAGELLLRLRQVPARASASATSKPTLCGRLGVARPGLPSPTTSQSTGAEPKSFRTRPSPSRPSPERRPRRPRPRRPRPRPRSARRPRRPARSRSRSPPRPARASAG